MISPARRTSLRYSATATALVFMACGTQSSNNVPSGIDGSVASNGSGADAGTGGSAGASSGASGAGGMSAGGNPTTGADAMGPGTGGGDGGQAIHDCGAGDQGLAEASLPATLISQVSNDTSLPSGEPWLATDPLNPQVIVVTWTTIGLPNYCGLARSADGGKTWTQRGKQVWGSRSGPVGDPALGVAPDGTFYVLCSYSASTGEYVMIKSTDSGLTWSQPVAITEGAKTYYDRPDLIVDPVTGDVYVSASDNSTNGRGVSVSIDHGATWSKFQAFAPGQSAWGDRIAAAGGVLAAGYILNPGGTQAQAPAVNCSGPCVVFQTSSDHGMTWSPHAVPAQNIVAGTSAGGPRIHVAADPLHRSHYAVLLPTNSQRALEIWVTADSGMNWTKAKELDAPMGDTQQKWSIAYGSTGALGVVWRTVHSDNTYDVAAAVAADGSTFGDAVPLTTTASAPSGIGDDCACNVYLDAHTLATSWGDSRSGNREAWFARVGYATPATCN